MKKITKADLKQLRILAGKLPRTYQDGEVSVSMMGSELMKNGRFHTKDGKAIDPNKAYKMQVADKRPVNHFRRLQTAYKDGGVPQVKKYCNGVVELVNAKSTLKFNNPFAWI